MITISNYSRDELITRLGVPFEKITVTPLAPAKLRPPAEHPPIPKPFILNVSNIYPHKNAQRLARAFISIADGIPHTLVIVGQQGAGEPAPHPRIKRFHRVPPDQLAALYRDCDILVFPSLFEGFGLPILEAVAAGAPVLAARAAAIPEVAGTNARYVDANSESAIAQGIVDALEESPLEKAARVAQSRAHADAFTWSRTAQITLEAFDRFEAR